MPVTSAGDESGGVGHAAEVGADVDHVGDDEQGA